MTTPMQEFIKQRYPDLLQSLKATKQYKVKDIRILQSNLKNAAFCYFDQSDMQNQTFDQFFEEFTQNICKEFNISYELYASVRPTRASCALIICKDQVLLEQCGYQLNKLTPPKGAIEEGETPFETLQREVLEELGLAKSVLPFDQYNFVVEDFGYQLAYVFRCEIEIQNFEIHPMSKQEVASAFFAPLQLFQAEKFRKTVCYPWCQEGYIERVLQKFGE